MHESYSLYLYFFFFLNSSYVIRSIVRIRIVEAIDYHNENNILRISSFFCMKNLPYYITSIQNSNFIKKIYLKKSQVQKAMLF